MIAATSDPFFPAVYAWLKSLGRAPGHYPIPFEVWLRWHRDCLLTGPGFVPCTAEQAARILAALATLPPEAA